MKWQAACGQRLYLGLVGVQAENLEPQIGQARRMRHAQIPVPRIVIRTGMSAFLIRSGVPAVEP